MAIFMTLLGKYSTRSHQREGELWQGDKMEAVIYLGAWGRRLGGQPLHRARAAKGRRRWWLSFTPPPPVSTHWGGGDQRWTQACQRLSLTPILHEALLHVQPPWHWGHRQLQVAGWQASEKSKETSGLQGRKSGSSSRCPGGRAAHTSRPGQRSSKSREGGRGWRRKGSHPPSRKQTEKKMRGCPALRCLTTELAWTRAQPAGTSGKWRKTKRMLPAATLQFCGPHQLFKVLLPNPSDYPSVPQYLNRRAAGRHMHQGPALAASRSGTRHATSQTCCRNKQQQHTIAPSIFHKLPNFVAN